MSADERVSTSSESVVLVTGAGGGIGQVIALAFADAGWLVYATDVETPLPDAVQAHCRCLALDVTDESACRAVVDRVVEETGRLDCLVNNAGYAEAGPVEDVPVDAGRDQFDVLVHGPHRMISAALPTMRARERGRIVTVSSVMGLASSPGLGVYAAGKAACESLHDALRVELRDCPNISVSMIEPAWVETEFADHARERLFDRDSTSRGRTTAYESTYDALEHGWVLDGNPLAVTPETVAERVVRAAETDDPSARYPVGGFAQFVRWSQSLPATVVDPIHDAYGRVTAILGRKLR